MAFSFNFDLQIKTDEEAVHLEDETKKHHEGIEAKPTDSDDTKPTPEKAKEHSPPSDCQSLLEDAVCETFALGTLPPIHYLNESVLELTMSELLDGGDVLSRSAAQNTDLVPGVYEGGLKVWECTYDLLEHLEAEGETFCGKRVLDLGCGAGLLGILALRRGAREVHFQDYNGAVIERLTLPNVLLNCEDDDDDDDDDDGSREEDDAGSPPPKRKASAPPLSSKLARCRFFSGSWPAFLAQVQTNDPPQKYDLIMTSETIYNTDYYPALHDVLQGLLDPRGLVYLATKVHYFGVGGGLYLFQNFVEERDVFRMKHVKEVEHGLQRHVVAMSFKKP